MSDPDWRPLDDDSTSAQVDGVAARIGPPPRRVLDFGCGDGRIMLPLLKRGYDVTGIDRDPRAIAACSEALSRASLPEAHIREADFLNAGSPAVIATQFDAVLCLGNTLMSMTDAEELGCVFDRAANFLRPGGVFIIDDFPFEYWREVAAGNWQEGVNQDGEMQIVWRPGEAIFSLRTGSCVDPHNWEIQPGDRMYRLWSWSELRGAGQSAGFVEAQHHPGGHIIVFVRGR